MQFRKIIKWAIFALLVATEVILSTRTGDVTVSESAPVAEKATTVINTIGAAANKDFVHFYIRKAAHVFMYMCIAFSGVIASLGTFKAHPIIKAYVLSCVIGIIDEIIKIAIPGRNFEFIDVLINLITITAVCAMSVLFVKKKGN